MNTKIQPANNLYTNPDFPFVMFTVTQERCTPPGPGYRYLHWHEDLQFTVVTKGSVSIMVNGTTYELHANQAIFINRGLLHMTNRISDDGEYVSFNFSSKLLSILNGSYLEADFVHKFTMNYNLPAIAMTSETPWQNSIISMLSDLRNFCLSETVYAKDYEISLRLGSIWLMFIRHVKDHIQISSKAFVRKQESMQTMLSFIHENFMQDLSLADIYKTVHISQAECCRLFKHFLNTSPYEYLITYRIHKAMDLLNETSLPVTEVSTRSGFNDCSHFIQQFKRFTGRTPKAYRNRQ